MCTGKSRVTINGEQVALNGNGSFTALVKIPTGESALKVEAVYRGKKAEVLQLVNREPTEEELQVEKEKQVREKREAADKAAELERVVNDLLAAKKATSVKEGVLRVLNNQIKEEAGFASVVGEVVNLGEEPVSWVMITANFLDQAGQTVDTKYGFATDFSEVIEPGERAEFETQATKKEFDHYSLDLSWEKGEVAGLATEPKEETASPAAEIEERKK